MQMDMTFWLIWIGISFVIIMGRAAFAAYRIRKKRNEMKKAEEKYTPLTRHF